MVGQKGKKTGHLSGRSVRSSRSTRRMPRIRLPPADATDTRMSTRDTNTRIPSKMFQLLCRYTPLPKYMPMATTYEHTHAHTHTNIHTHVKDFKEATTKIGKISSEVSIMTDLGPHKTGKRNWLHT